MLTLISLLALSVISFGHPINRVYRSTSKSEPKWYNHCKTSFSTREESSQTKNDFTKQMFKEIEKLLLTSLKNAEDVQQKFVDFEPIFNDLESLRLKSDFEWLPQISVSEQSFTQMTSERALITAHEFIEKFAVALEQVLDDQNEQNNDIYNEAIKRHHFINIDKINYKILCEIRIAMSVVLEINEWSLTQTNRSIMPEDDRHITEMSKRMLRDYLIVRQYVKTIEFVHKMFKQIGQNHR